MNDLASHLKTIHVNRGSEDKIIDSVQKKKMKKTKVQCIPVKVTPDLEFELLIWLKMLFHYNPIQ